MTPNPRPRSRRERPAKAALTRDGIVETAVRLMRAEGLQRVTMRRLAQELDTGAASLYVYVANTAELHAAILDELLGQVDLAPAGAAGDWRERIEAVLGSYSEVLYQHPSLARSALVARPCGPHYLNLLEALLALLAEGQVPDDRAAWGVDVLLGTVTASAAEHAPGETAQSDADWNALTRALESASPARNAAYRRPRHPAAVRNPAVAPRLGDQAPPRRHRAHPAADRLTETSSRQAR